MLILLATLVLASGTLGSLLCPSHFNPEVTVHIPHPTDCGKFLTCVGSHPVEQDCPGGLHWNEQDSVCDYPRTSRCSRDLSPDHPKFNPGALSSSVCLPAEANRCPLDRKRHDEVVFLKHHDCKKFYACVSDQPVELSCPLDLYWNSKSCACDYGVEEDCDDYGQRPEEPEPEEPVDGDQPDIPEDPEVPQEDQEPQPEANEDKPEEQPGEPADGDQQDIPEEPQPVPEPQEPVYEDEHDIPNDSEVPQDVQEAQPEPAEDEPEIAEEPEDQPQSDDAGDEGADTAVDQEAESYGLLRFRRAVAVPSEGNSTGGGEAVQSGAEGIRGVTAFAVMFATFALYAL